MGKRYFTIGYLLLILCLLISVIGCNGMGENGGTAQVTPQVVEEEGLQEEEMLQEEAPEIKPYTTEAKLLAVGDIMMHSTQTKAGYDPSTDTYNYDDFFTEVKEILSDGDWVTGNLETPVAGKDLEFTGYPMFNAPEAILDALKNAGFNIITAANNHSLDRGEVGVIRTRENILARGFFSHGTARSFEEAKEIPLVTKNEITMAFLAYTYGTNGIPIPEGKDYLVNLIDQERILADIQRARDQGADVVTVSLHFGTEYQTEPNAEQISLAEALIKGGADIILGSHPHVVQPYQVLEVRDELGNMRKGVVIYSLGNFIAGQKGDQRNLGVIFGVTVRKHFPEGTIEIAEITTQPTWIQRYRKNNKQTFRVLPIEKTLAEHNDPYLTKNDFDSLQKHLETMKQHLNSLSIPVDKNQ